MYATVGSDTTCTGRRGVTEVGGGECVCVCVEYVGGVGSVVW